MKEASKQQKLYTILFTWPWGVRSLGLVSVIQTERVSHALVYSEVDVNKIVAIFKAKLPAYMYVQSTTLQKL